MVFSSLFFLLCFLPIQLITYFITPSKYRNYTLLAFSIIFYAWSGPFYVLILAGLSLVSFLIAKAIDETADAKKKKFYLILELIIHLSVLVFFKYLSFGAELVNSVLAFAGIKLLPVPNIILPIGISFYTFQLISYVVDVYRNEVKANKSYLKVLLYAGLFHQCIAGPIVRYKTVENEIENRKIVFDDVFSGLLRFSTGLFKKAVLANACASVADTLLSESVDVINKTSVIGLWIGALFYALQIYLDFSAYSDMAIGMGRMTGFHYLENFNYPYIAKSVTDFWRRWHISLSSFFRDYVYIPLGGNRVKPFKHIINLLVVWFLTGLWHGASVNFIVWGLYYFVFLIIEKYASKIIKINNKYILAVLKCLYYVFTMCIVIIGWVIFRYDSSECLFAALNNMFMAGSNELWNMNTESVLLANVNLLIVAVIVSTPLIKIIYRKLRNNSDGLSGIMVNFANMVMPAVLIILSLLALAGNSYNPFIYYRF